MSTVRHNMETRRGYTPFCGNTQCVAGMPRASFNGSQFECKCGWRSAFEDEVIRRYKEFNSRPASSENNVLEGLGRYFEKIQQ